MKTVLERVSSILNDAVMGFLALAALAAAMIPVLFDVSPSVNLALDVCEWFVVMLFALEYVASLMAASKKRDFVLEPWRLLDLAIILGPLLSLLPRVTDSLRSTPVLRLLRLVRVVVFSARAGSGALRRPEQCGAGLGVEPLNVSVLFEGEEATPRISGWADLLRWVGHPSGGWYHVRNATPEGINDLTKAATLPEKFVELRLSVTSYPRIEAAGPFSSLFVWLPVAPSASERGFQRVGTLLLCNEHAICSVSRQDIDLHATVASELCRLSVPSGPFPPRMICAVFRILLSRYEEVSNHLEGELREMELLPPHDSSEEFFEGAFRLKRELSSAKADLWRLRRLLDSLAKKLTVLPGFGAGHGDFLRMLSDEAEYLHDTVNHNREGVVSLIELHLNIVSFGMNKFMRLLAAVSVLGLIPAVVGGLFGMNLLGNPWPLTLPQVGFGVLMAMLTCLYLFLVRGWLR